MTVDVVTFGCRLNAHESEVIRRAAAGAGLADTVVNYDEATGAGTGFVLRDLDAGSLGDTIGSATPEKIERMLHVVTGEICVTKLAGHFHDTQGRALENIA